MVWIPNARTPGIAPNPIAITKIIAIINSGTALKKTVIVLATKKIIIFGAIFLAESKARGIDKTIAIKVPIIAISIVSSIASANVLKLEKSGGYILEKISAKYLNESENKFIKFNFKSIETKTNNKIVDIMNTKVFHVHCGLK